MGFAKHILDERDYTRTLALDLLKDVGALKECETHEGTFYDKDEGQLQEAYNLANAKISRGEIELPSGMERRDFTDVVKETYNDNSGIDYCVSCDKVFGKDD
jgi:hypothetical protein